jgi:hypothetical protein
MISRLNDSDSDLRLEEFRVLSISARLLESEKRPLTYFKTSSAIISRNSAANSTPVGPPPQMTNESNRFRSSGVVVGREASSKLATY